jgi:hypothetical protein
MNPISLLKSFGVDTRAAYQTLSAASLDRAAEEQGLADLRQRLRAILPDISDQYSGGLDPKEYERYWERKLRGLHAFQIKTALEALDILGGSQRVLADIGDSSGNHALYLKALAPKDRISRVVSVNLDPVAVEKVKAKGGDAILARAEEMDLEGIAPDLFFSFEMVEHLTDPLRFLHRLAEMGKADHLLMTVPYRKTSRFGGAELRGPESALPASMTAEELHLFELNPGDWLRMARLAGWREVFSRTYLQYPKRHPLFVTQPLWRCLDFEGFWGVLLKRDLSVAERYKAW